ncbi:MAG: hypothetical protein AAFW89_05225 [Bacteroidota bacterium]
MLVTNCLATAQELAQLEAIDEWIMQDQVPEARAAVQELLNTYPKSYDVLWRASRVELLTGEQSEGKKLEKKHYREALNLADRAVKANKKGSHGYMRRAAANGKLALFEGVLTANEYVNAVRDDAEKALKLNSESPYQMATAHYILGRTHVKLSETPAVLRMPLDLEWGDFEEGLEHLEKAVEMRPGFIMYNLDFARALIEDKQDDKARVILKNISSLDEVEPGDKLRKNEALELLNSL